MPLYNPDTGAKASATSSTSAPTTTSATYVVIPEMTVTLIGSGRSVLVNFVGSFNIQNNDDFTIGIHLDSSLLAETEQRISFFGGTLLGLTPANITAGSISANAIVSGSSALGSHTYDIRWKRAAGTARAITTQRQFMALELF